MGGALSHLPLALGGGALSSDNIVIAAVSLLSIVAGYVLLAALWYFVFRQKPADKEAERRATEAALARSRGAATRSDSTESATAPSERRGDDDGAAKLERRLGPRFRRR